MTSSKGYIKTSLLLKEPHFEYIIKIKLKFIKLSRNSQKINYVLIFIFRITFEILIPNTI